MAAEARLVGLRRAVQLEMELQVPRREQAPRKRPRKPCQGARPVAKAQGQGYQLEPRAGKGLGRDSRWDCVLLWAAREWHCSQEVWVQTLQLEA